MAEDALSISEDSTYVDPFSNLFDNSNPTLLFASSNKSTKRT